MNYVFKVGEICIGQNFLTNTECNGMEREIIGGLELREWMTPDGRKGMDMSYMVRWADGHECSQIGYNLRPKRPPKRAIDEVVSWETVGWMPFEVKFDRAIKQSLRDQLREKV
jgi:hypothetical protein